MKFSFLIILSCVFYSSCLKIKPKSGDPSPEFSNIQEPSPESSSSLNSNHEEDLKDLVIDREIVLSQLKTILKARRLYFTPHAKIFTDGREIVISAKEIYFQDTVLQTFRDGQKAAADQQGRGGGRITIVADSAHGRLVIDPRGEDGGDGSEGAAPGPELKGAAGSAGEHGIIGEERIIRAEEWEPNRLVTLKKQPTRGGMGDPGRRGYTGKSGRDGGPSAWLRVGVLNSEDLQLEILKSESRGGESGRGGLGGEGGDPGSAGLCFQGYNPKLHFLMKFENCVIPTPAEKGSRGPEGNTGERGKNGKWIEPCVSPLLDRCIERSF